MEDGEQREEDVALASKDIAPARAPDVLKRSQPWTCEGWEPINHTVGLSSATERLSN